MPSLDERFASALSSSQLNGAVLLATNASGTFNFYRAYGNTSMKPHPPSDVLQPMSKDTVMRVHSAAKIVTVTAAMQAVERGLLSLDAPIGPHVPELAAKQVLHGFNDDTGEPVLRDPATPVTLRHLLTHSSGVIYHMMHPFSSKWNDWTGGSVPARSIDDEGTIAGSFPFPLMYDPGTQWSYGASTDWVGRAVESANGGISLDEYVRENIAKPLGVTDMAFKVGTREDMVARRAWRGDKSGASGKVEDQDDDYWDGKWKDDFGGMGFASTPAAMFEVYKSLLKNDGKLLKKETVDELFKPQLTPDSEGFLNERYQEQLSGMIPGGLQMGGVLPHGIKLSHGLGGIINLEALEGWRSEMTMGWSGYANWYWFVDRKAQLTGLFATQISPFNDVLTRELGIAFEKEIYRLLKDSESS